MKNKKKSRKPAQTESSGSESEDENTSDVQVTSSTKDAHASHYEHIEENIYLFDRKKRINKEVRRMQCDCSYDPDQPELLGCGEDCLNRLLMIECNQRCPCKDFCTNRNFQQGCKVKVGVLKTEKKGFGLATFEDLEANQFVLEYCGEVMNYKTFQDRAERYDQENRTHYYFMTLRADEVIDATRKGNLSRFINHSCDPNCVTQKWTVNGLLRIGFFTLRAIPTGTELTFDYQLQRYGKVAQPCYCESVNCRGIIGGEKLTPLKNTVERIATPPTCSPRRRKKRSMVSEFSDETLEDELDRLVGDHRYLTNTDQALTLSRLMVRAVTLEQRIMLLKVLQRTTDQSCLKAFVRFQGLSLLWSWMADGAVKLSITLKKELISTLKYLPIATKNQLDDSKVSRVLTKWSVRTAQNTETEVGSSSSGADSNGNSPTESECPPVHHGNGSESKENNGAAFERQYSGGKEQSDDEALDAEVAKLSSTRETKRAAESTRKSPDEMSEDEGKSEDDPSSISSSEDDEEISIMAKELLESWSKNLKEVYRIPKKSATPVKKEKEPVTTTVPSPGRLTTFSDLSQLNRASSPGKLDQLFKNLGSSLEVNSPKHYSDSEQTPKDEAQGTEVVASVDEPGLGLQGSNLDSKNFDDDFPAGVDSPAKSDISPSEMQAIPTINPNSGSPSKQTFGYQQKMGPRIEKIGGSSYRFGRFPKSRKRRSVHQRLQDFARQSQQSVPTFQQTPSMQGGMNYSDYSSFGNMNPSIPAQASNWSSLPMNTAPQAAPNFTVPNFCPPAMPPPPQIPPPNVPMPPHEFFRKVPPPNFPLTQAQQVQPLPPHAPNYPPPQILQTAPFPTPATQPAYPQYLPPAYLPGGQVTQYPSVPAMPAQMTNPQVPPTQPGQSTSFLSQSQVTGVPQTEGISPPLLGSVPKEGISDVTQSPTPQPITTLVHETGSTDISSSGIEPKNMEDEAMVVEPSPVKSKPKVSDLPSNWRSAVDPQGKVYYYHAITRQTQWERPTANAESTFATEIPDQQMMVSEKGGKPGFDYEDIKKEKKRPSTPPGTPPVSPTLAYTTAAADTTEHGSGSHTSPSLPSSDHLHRQRLSLKETFRMKLSNVVVNCLNPYFKVTCQQGRVTNANDFKYLARKLTHAVMMKEINHLENEDDLQCNDSVKIKTKEFVRAYMSKFGAIYKRA